jgi:hypothetical protein
MVNRSWMLLALPAFAACASEPRQEAYRPPAYRAADVKSGAPQIQYGVERTGLEFQVDRGSRAGDEVLGGKVVIERVTDNSSLGVLQADIQVKSRSAEPIHALYRIVFHDDQEVPVGPVFSAWQPLAIGEPFGTATLHETCSQRKAVYFVLETWAGGAQAKAPEEKK